MPETEQEIRRIRKDFLKDTLTDKIRRPEGMNLRMPGGYHLRDDFLLAVFRRFNMTDPYQILGVSRDASDDDIKKAYRNLSRKYHPDANVNNPNKAQAEAKFKEIQQAYQQIIKEKESGYSSGFYQQQASSSTENEEDLHLRAAASYINSRHYQEALHVLNNINDRSDKWYYYSAIANSGLGNNVIALEHAKTAYQMNPNDIQYQMFLQRLQSGGSWYQSMQSPYQTYSMGGGNYCMKLCIANLVCNLCCGGGMCCGGPGYYGGGYI